ncbi:hypothetical protein NHH73_25750 [Oxalobacteraceae bacterium OTU3CINTB1]|nr:hypothetical protein NHH73_25750 [Oxalobacteraceae bacterium OTU3CINTB1]
MKILHGTTAWFDMVGALMKDAAAQAALPADFNVSLVERYTDGVQLGAGLAQGLRFEIVGGKPSFRLGAGPNEQADITVEVTVAGSRQLNTLHGADPRFSAALAKLQSTGQLKIDGDLARLGGWFDGVHDQIVQRTR